MKLDKGMALISYPRHYGDNFYPGWPAMVVKSDKVSVTVLMHDLNQITLKVLDNETFAKSFMPDMAVPGWYVAMTIYHMRNFLKTAEEAEMATKNYLEATAKPAKAKIQALGAENKFAVCVTHQRRTCIQVYRDTEVVQYIPLTGGSFEVYEAKPKDFNHEYSEIDYDVSRAADHYIKYAMMLGASEEALGCLGNLTDITATDRKTILSHRRAAEDTVAAMVASGGLPASKEVAQVPQAATERSKKASTGVGSEIQRLLRLGELTDAEIFKQVQQKFGLPDHKKRYVQSYRCTMRSRGEKVPDPIKK